MKNKEFIDEQEMLDYAEGYKKTLLLLVKIVNEAYKKGFEEGRKSGAVND